MRRRPLARIVVLTCLLATPAAPAADEPSPSRLRVAPGAIELSSARDRQSIVVLAEYADGSTRDVTARARASVEPAVATVREGVVAPSVDGKATLRLEFDGVRAEASVAVRRASAVDPIRIRNDVQPA
jgi:hypothetical protein